MTMLLIISSCTMYAQEIPSEYLLNGIFLRGGQISFSKALILDSDESTELWLDQKKSMISYGIGYDYLPKDSWVGVGGSIDYSTTNLNQFSIEKFASSDILLYSNISYSFLFFDANIYLVPIENIPFAFSIGFTLDGSFHSYKISGDKSQALNVNGNQSMNIFRYGYILGCKIIPLKFISVEFEFRPMAGYSVTHSYTLGDYAYSSGGLDYYYIKDDLGSKEGESENMYFIGISIHF